MAIEPPEMRVKDLLKILDGVDPETPIALEMNGEYFWWATSAVFEPETQTDFYGHGQVFEGPMIVVHG